jgi:type IV pilus assembly protein PilV
MRSPFAWYGPRGAQHGVALLEALLAIVILSIGLLGVIALQVRGLHNAHSAHQRTLASIIATDAGERLWIALADPPPGAATEDDILEAVTAAWLAQWQAADPTLPGLDGEIASDPGSADIQHYVVQVNWTDPRFADDDDATGDFLFVYRASLPAALGAGGL